MSFKTGDQFYVEVIFKRIHLTSFDHFWASLGWCDMIITFTTGYIYGASVCLLVFTPLDFYETTDGCRRV